MCDSIREGGKRCDGRVCGEQNTVPITDPQEVLARARRARAKLRKAANIEWNSPDYEMKTRKLQNDPDAILANRTIAILEGWEVAGSEGDDDVPKASKVSLDPNRKRVYPQYEGELRNKRTSTTLSRHDVKKLEALMVDEEGKPLTPRERAARLREAVLSLPDRSPLGEAQIRYQSDKLRTSGRVSNRGRNQTAEAKRTASNLYFNFTEDEYNDVKEWAEEFKLAPTEYLRRRALGIPLEPSDGWITVNKHEERMTHLFSDSHAQNYDELVRQHMDSDIAGAKQAA